MSVINVTAGSTLNIGYSNVSNNYYYNIDGGSDVPLNTFPVSIRNVDPIAGPVHVELQTDLPIFDSSTYFLLETDNIIFDGQGHQVTVDNVPAFLGVIGRIEYENIVVENLSVVASDSLSYIADNAGAVVNSIANTATTTEVINCSSSIVISGINAGGIVGAYSHGTITNCSSSGEVSGYFAGGIVGGYAADGSGGYLVLNNCSSTGTIAGDGAGGIFGGVAANGGGQVSISGSYSTGQISGAYSGGVVGYAAAYGAGLVEIISCHSSGDAIGDGTGGIVGGSAGFGGGQVDISRSYSSGAINGNSAGGIVGVSAAGNGGHVYIHESYSTGGISGDNAGGIAGSSAGVDGGAVDIVNVYSTGVVNGQFAGGIAGSSAGYNGGQVSLVNVFATGVILAASTGGVLGDGVGLGSGGSLVSVSNAYTSGFGILNGILSNTDGSGDDNFALLGLEGVQNYSEANNGNSGTWTDTNAIYTVDHPYGLRYAGHSTLTDVWLIPPAANTAFSLAVFDAAPTLSSISTLPGNQAGAVYTLDFAHLLAASNATDSDGSVVAFQIDLNDSSGTFYSGPSFNTAMPVTVSALLDATHNLYWRPNQVGVVRLGDAVAEDDLGAYSVGSASILFTVSGVQSNGNSINLNGLNVSAQSISGSGSLSLGQGALTIIGNGLNCLGGAAQNNPLGINNIGNLCAGLFNNFSNNATILNQNISQFISTVTTKNGGYSNNYNCAYLADFQGSANFAISSYNSNPYITNCLNLINNQGPSQNVDLTAYQGMLIINSGINVTGVTQGNVIGMLGGTCTLGAGNQTVYLMGPNATVNGGSGISTVDMLGVSQNSISIMQQGKNVKVWSDWLGSGSGVTNLNNVDRIQLNDGMFALDTGAGESAGQVFRLYEAAFHRVGDPEGVGYWLNQVDSGARLEEIANQFIRSQEFINLYGSSPSNNQFISALYQNVLGRAPDAAGLNYWLNSGLNKAQLLIQFAESPEGIAHVSGQMAHGVQYQQWVQ